MRYYDISILDYAGNPPSILANTSLTSTTLGFTNQGALNIEFDLPISTCDIPLGNGYVKIWGVGLDVINQASTLINGSIVINAGMAKGLPLATQQATAIPFRNSTVIAGTIFKAFGNWQGTEQTLDLIISTQLSATGINPKLETPFVFNCQAGQSFSSALKLAFENAALPITVNVSSSLVPSKPIVFYANNIPQFAKQVLNASNAINQNPNYLGVVIKKTPQGYEAFDNTTPTTSKKIDFTDLIGQPTWLDFAVVQCRAVLRSDINVGDTVTFPTPDTMPILNSPQSNSQLKNYTSYTGTAFVRSVRHIGNFRQQDANSWVTVIEVIPNQISIDDVTAGQLSGAQNPVGI